MWLCSNPFTVICFCSLISFVASQSPTENAHLLQCASTQVRTRVYHATAQGHSASHVAAVQANSCRFALNRWLPPSRAAQSACGCRQASNRARPNHTTHYPSLSRARTLCEYTFPNNRCLWPSWHSEFWGIATWLGASSRTRHPVPQLNMHHRLMLESHSGFRISWHHYTSEQRLHSDKYALFAVWNVECPLKYLPI